VTVTVTATLTLGEQWATEGELCAVSDSEIVALVRKQEGVFLDSAMWSVDRDEDAKP